MMMLNSRLVEVKERRGGVKCDFCHASKIDPLMLGPMYKLTDVTVHYFCLLFSAGLCQLGEDEQGILGFLPKDIKTELKRGKKLRCKYCKDSHATVGCSVRNCKVSFHYPCGLENGSLYQFIDQYESYCIKHRPLPIIPLPLATWTCPICYCNFDNEKYPIKPPCCSNNAVFHRKCIMEAASKSGSHFFKCPLCNDKETFVKSMRLQGIYVPDRDAEWELVPNAYEELNHQYNKCDKQSCICPFGREFNEGDGENKDWKIIRCGGCGGAGIHMKCGDLKVFTYRCETCSSVLIGTNLDTSLDETNSQNTRRSSDYVSRSPRISRRQIIYSDDEDEGDEPIQPFWDTAIPKPGVLRDDESDSSDTSSDSTTSTSKSSVESQKLSIKKKFKGIPKRPMPSHSGFVALKPKDVSSEEEDDDDEEDYVGETEVDFVSPSKKNISQELDDKNDSLQVRTGLVEVASQNNNNSSDLLDMVNKVYTLINAHPSTTATDRTLRNLYALPDMPRGCNSHTNNNTPPLPSSEEELLRKVGDIFKQNLLSVINQVTSENQQQSNNQKEIQNQAHCSYSSTPENMNVPTPTRNESTTTRLKKVDNMINKVIPEKKNATATTSLPTTGPTTIQRSQLPNTATALKNLNSCTKNYPNQQRKFYPGTLPPPSKMTNGLSAAAALIATSSGLAASKKNKVETTTKINSSHSAEIIVLDDSDDEPIVSNKIKVETKTNSGSGPVEIVTLDDSDDEGGPTTTKTSTSNPSNNAIIKSEGKVDVKPNISGENDTMPIPNRDRDLLQSCIPKRVRGADGESKVVDSKRPRV